MHGWQRDTNLKVQDWYQFIRKFKVTTSKSQRCLKVPLDDMLSLYTSLQSIQHAPLVKEMVLDIYLKNYGTKQLHVATSHW